MMPSKRRDIGERFWSKVEKTDGCWIWGAYCNPDGYGEFTIGRGHRVAKAHRMAWELTYGSPGKARVFHHCRNRSCVRPEHLFPGRVANP